MRNEYFFRVAGLTFSVILPGGLDAETLLPSFRPFRCGERTFPPATACWQD